LSLARRRPETLVDMFLDLQGRLACNSTNSHQPPAADGLAKPAPKSLREKTGRKPGGQPGHPGATLALVENADHVQTHQTQLCTCGFCQRVSLAGQPVLAYERRQVFDLPPLRLEVTEHRAEIKLCPVSGLLVMARFPAGVVAPVQYGPHFRGLTLYLFHQQILPFDRLRQACQDWFGQPLSLGTLTQTNARAHQALAPVEAVVVRGLIQADVVNVDESGLRVAGRLHWLQVACTAELTFYGVHGRRGAAAMDALGVLPHCQQWLVHDHWKPYCKYDAFHALCHQHRLRELKFLAEEGHEAWAARLTTLLLDWKDDPRTQQGLTEAQFQAAYQCDRAGVRQGRQTHPRRQPGQGRTQQGKAANRLDRLEDFDLSVLAFLIDPNVPFTNNQGERDIRMIKVKQKISGCFRTWRGAQIFARIRGDLSTCRKQDRNLWEACYQLALGQPFMPNVPAAGP